MDKKLNPLTPREKTAAEQSVYQAWLERQALYNPPPKPDTTDMVHESPWVVRAMTSAVAFLPLLLALIGVAAVVISSDKTMFAFHESVANKDAGWGVWSAFVALMAVLMVEGGLVFAEFGAVRDALKKGLHRQVWNIGDLWRGVKVRLGQERPLDYSEMPDSSLKTYSRFMFLLVLMANTYGVLHAYTGKGKTLSNLSDVEYLELTMFMFVGIAGAVSLRLIGAQLAHMVYDLMEHRRAEEERDLHEEWRCSLLDLWKTQGPELIALAMHERYVSKNGLQPGTKSPYLLLASVDERGEPDIQASPLAQSSMESQNE